MREKNYEYFTILPRPPSRRPCLPKCGLGKLQIFCRIMSENFRWFYLVDQVVNHIYRKITNEISSFIHEDFQKGKGLAPCENQDFQVCQPRLPKCALGLRIFYRIFTMSTWIYSLIIFSSIQKNYRYFYLVNQSFFHQNMCRRRRRLVKMMDILPYLGNHLLTKMH